MFDILAPFLPGFLRSSGLFSVVLPSLGLNSPVRIGALAMLLAFILPVVPDLVTVSSLSGDFAIGVLLGLPTALCLSFAGQYGELIDVVRGQTLGSILDPLSRASVAPLAMLYRYWLWTTLLAGGLLTGLLKNISDSLKTIPATYLFRANLPELGEKIVDAAVAQFQLVAVAIAPVIIAVIGVELVLMALTKLVPQVNLQGEGFLLKMLAVFAVLSCLADSAISGLVTGAQQNILTVVPGGR